jgi:hypothetical protein
VRYSCHHNSSRFTFPISAHLWCFSVFHSLQSITNFWPMDFCWAECTTYAHTHVHTHIHTHTHAHAHTRTHARARAHTHTHTHRTKGLKELNDSGHCTLRHLTYTH